jgi:hypothetical protein
VSLVAGWLMPLCAARAQEGQEVNPVAALTAALVGACRQNEKQFAHYLTSENAAIFDGLVPEQRREVLKRFLLLDVPGRPLLSSDARGRTVLRCETPGITAEIRFGQERVSDNLAFIPIEVSGGRRIEFGMVREGGGWRILSVGLLLFNLNELQKQWAEQELERKEAAGVAEMRKLAEAIKTYRRAFGVLPENLRQLGPAPKEGASPEAASLVDAELAAGMKAGYRFRYRILPAPEEGGEPGFELAAVPSEYGRTGRRSFFLDHTGKLRGGDKQGAVATAADPPIEVRQPPNP